MTIRKTALGELFRIGSSKRVLQSQWNSEGVPFYRGREITRLAADGFVDNELFISEDLYAEFAAKNGVPNAGDIMITAIGTIGNSYIVRESDRFYFKDASVLWLKKSSDVSSEFVNWWLKSPLFFEQLDTGNGATVDTLTIQKLQSVLVDLPSAEEQQRIVGILGQAFSGIATAKANAEKNLQNARALFESHLQSVFTQRDERWVEKPLAETCEIFADGDWIESKDQSPEGIRLIQTGNVGVGVFKDRGEKARHISEATFKRLRCTEIFEGDCLISRLPDPVGRSCLLPDTGERMITAVDCTIVRFKSNQVNPAYFNYYSQSSTYLSAVDSETTGTTRNRISRSKLGLVPIPIAPLAEQKRIVARLDYLSAETQRLGSICQQKLDALDDLKNSLLHQAFSGQL